MQLVMEVAHYVVGCRVISFQASPPRGPSVMAIAKCNRFLSSFVFALVKMFKPFFVHLFIDLLVSSCFLELICTVTYSLLYSTLMFHVCMKPLSSYYHLSRDLSFCLFNLSLVFVLLGILSSYFIVFYFFSVFFLPSFSC